MLQGTLKLIDSQFVKKFPDFMEPVGSLPFSQKTNIEIYAKPAQSSPHSHTLFL
jgi:hypothetical protein